MSYYRYVDDTFIVFDGTLRQIELLKNYLNSVNKLIQFVMRIVQMYFIQPSEYRATSW